MIEQDRPTLDRWKAVADALAAAHRWGGRGRQDARVDALRLYDEGDATSGGVVWFTVTNVDVLVEALEDARRAVVALDGRRAGRAMSLPGGTPERLLGDLGPAGGR